MAQQDKYLFSETQWRLISGAISGAVSRSFVAPIERTIILKQTNASNYQRKSLIRCLYIMYTEEGARSMFKGNGANCLRIAPFQAIEFYLFDILKNTFQFKNQNAQNISMLIFGAFSGALATMTVYPFDLVKTILAVQTKQEYKGITDCLIKIVQRKGPLSLFKGLSATLIGISPYSSFKLTFFQILRQKLSSLMGFINKDTQNLIFGGLAGCMALSITYPTDVIRRRLQVQILQQIIELLFQKQQVLFLIFYMLINLISVIKLLSQIKINKIFILICSRKCTLQLFRDNEINVQGIRIDSILQRIILYLCQSDTSYSNCVYNQ